MAVLLALAACGGGGPPPSERPAISTLAYVVNDCHEDAQSTSASQRLLIRRGDEAPVTVAEIPTYGQLPPLGLCRIYGALRAGEDSVYVLAFQRLGVSPDGSSVVFEVTFEFSFISPLGVRNPLTPEQEGIFFVGADNKVRKLGPPSREPAQRLSGIPSLSVPAQGYADTLFKFSLDGRSVTFADRGPGPSGEDAAQVVILDIATGKRTQVTRLPATAPDPANPVAAAVLYAFFQDDDTIVFFSRANPADPTGTEPNGLNPEGPTQGIFRFFNVKTDGSQLAVLPLPVVLPGGFVPRPQITGSVTSLDNIALSVPGTPVNLAPFDALPAPIQEVFVSARDHTLQLTHFGRLDTGNALISSDGSRVYFTASADPPELHGSNPSETCQIFSITDLGTDLRQLTHFGAADHSAIGCRRTILDQSGCFIYAGPIFDPHTQTLIFESSCDPFGTNPDGEQFFVMRPDGSGLRQLTAVRGVVAAQDGSVDVQLPGPIGYSSDFR